MKASGYGAESSLLKSTREGGGIKRGPNRENHFYMHAFI
jgi:hypothetical protein